MNDPVERLLASLRRFRGSDPKDGDVVNEIGSDVELLAHAAFVEDASLAPNHSPDGFLPRSIDFRSRKVLLIGTMWSIGQEELPCEVRLAVNGPLTKLTRLNIRYGDASRPGQRPEKSLVLGSIQWIVELTSQYR